MPYRPLPIALALVLALALLATAGIAAAQEPAQEPARDCAQVTAFVRCYACNSRTHVSGFKVPATLDAQGACQEKDLEKWRRACYLGHERQYPNGYGDVGFAYSYVIAGQRYQFVFPADCMQ